MNTYNLDINKYNNTELENLLKLKKNYNLKDLDNAKNKILNNLSKKEGMEDKKATFELFLDNIYNKLSNKLKEIYNDNNNKLEQFDKHFIIQNHNKGYSILDNNQPIEKSIIKKTYNIDSQFRKNYLETSTNYTLDLPEKIQKVITMSISSINIPLTYYNISHYNKNNILSLYSINRNVDETNKELVGELLKDITLNNGIYTNENIIEEIQNGINTTDLSNVLQCNIDKTSGLVYFVLSPLIRLKRLSSSINHPGSTITEGSSVRISATINVSSETEANTVSTNLNNAFSATSITSPSSVLGIEVVTHNIEISSTSEDPVSVTVVLTILVRGGEDDINQEIQNNLIKNIADNAGDMITEGNVNIEVNPIVGLSLQEGDTISSGKLNNQSSIIERTGSGILNTDDNIVFTHDNTKIYYGVLADKNNQNFKVRYTIDDISNSKLLNAIYLDKNDASKIIDIESNIEDVVGFYIKLNYSDHSFERLNCSDSNNNCSSRKEIYDDRRIIQQKQLTHMLGLQSDESLIENVEIKKKDFKRISATKPDDWLYAGTSNNTPSPIEITYKDMMFNKTNVNDIRHLDLRNASINGVMNSISKDEHLFGHGIDVSDYNRSNQYMYTIPDPYDIYLARKFGINNENFGSLPCYISYPKYVYIAIDDFQANSKNYFTLATESLLSPNIIARINISALLEEKKNNNNNSINAGAAIDFLTNQKNIREYFGPTNINRLKISLIDEYGELLHLNDRDWSFLLTFECLYN
tara:strand:+ start:5512 stop:7773 length:2262 start_codon:yes stop_codon:yes gene_type:complete